MFAKKELMLIFVWVRLNLKAAYWADPSLYIKPFARWQLRMATDLCGDETEFIFLAIRCIT
jgi:hypothetical protein